MTLQLAGLKAVVTGGSRGLGLGIVEALVAGEARVTVVAKNPDRLEAVKQRLGVAVIAGELTDRALARHVLREVRPSLLVLNAGAAAPLVPIEAQTWEGFSAAWPPAPASSRSASTSPTTTSAPTGGSCPVGSKAARCWAG